MKMKRFRGVGKTFYDDMTPIFTSRPQTVKFLASYLNEIFERKEKYKEKHKNEILGQIDALFVALASKDYHDTILNARKLKELVERG